MKSIKEKAEEFAITNKNSLGYIMQEHVDGYIAGANYVLEQISQTLQGDLNSHSAFKLKTIKQIIEELKK